MTARSVRRAAVVVLAGWVAVTTAVVAVAATDLAAARRAAHAAEASDVTDVRDGRFGSLLGTVHVRASRAKRLLGLPVLAPVRLLPVLGRQLRSVGTLAGAVDEIALTGRAVAGASTRLVHSPPPPGPARVTALREVRTSLTAADERLVRVDLGPDANLVGPLAEARADVATTLGEARDRIRAAIEVIATVADLLEGPQRYLLLVCNNAEMRAGSGIPLSIGTIDTQGGTLRLGDVIPAADLRLSSPLEVPGDLGERWGFTNPGQEWRSLGMSPRFAANAQLATRLWEARTGEQVDGVLAVDIAALRLLVDATAPVVVEAESLQGEKLQEFLMHDQYEGSVRDHDQSARRELLGTVARQAVDRIQGGEVDETKLVRNLAEAAAGRHLLAWARDPEAQRGWAAAGAAGAVVEDSLLLGLVNRGENKLDHFVRVRHRLRTTARPDGGWAVDVVTTVENSTPSGETDYVAGPVVGLTDVAGTYLGLLSATVPGAATHISISKDGAACGLAAAGADGPTRVAACAVSVPAGGSAELTTSFRLPPQSGTLRIEPSARIPPAAWEHDGRKFTDGRRIRIALLLPSRGR